MELDEDACYRAVETRDARFDGRFFTAVRSTNIYCRPVCPARTPLRRNVEFYPSAAAAQEAGFRPCLRCRPETAPDLGAWRGTSNTVSRALRLIELGALDDGDVETLAERLGVGGRHLRRLFKQHLGATPVSVAQTRRVLLAKQLIHETKLSMTDVALASGFKSIRRFNEAFQELYAKSPGELRRSSKQNAETQNRVITVRLRFKPPYDWDAMLAFFRSRAISGLERVADDSYSRVIEINEKRGWVSVAPAGRNDLKADIGLDDLSMFPEVIARLKRVFDLSLDPIALNAVLGEDQHLAGLVAARPGLRSPGAWDAFEMAVRAILGQQISVAGAATIGARLCDRLGQRTEGFPQGLEVAFPTAEAVRDADLTDIGMPKARIKALQNLAGAYLDNPDLLSPQQSLDTAVAQLCAVPGIGPWTAQYIALRALREPDAFPASDVALLRSWAERTGAKPAPQELEDHAEAWRPWRGYAAQHLWAAL